MTSLLHQSVRSDKPVGLLIAAVAALLAGLLVYVGARPFAPVLIYAIWPDSWSESIQGSVRIPFAYQLPSFFHAMAMMLATLAVTWNRRQLRRPALVVTIGLCLLMEFVQHRAVVIYVSACADTLLCRWVPGLEAYARRGTFDPLDLLAIAAAAPVVWTLYQSDLFNALQRRQKDAAK